MKANELRIWNLVDLYRGDIHYEICVVENISYIGINERLEGEYRGVFKNQLNDELLIKPIPLTEEWLEKFGFNFSFNEHFEYFKLDGITITKASKDSFYYQTDLITTKINYVHQLQNLYFALIGKELTTKKGDQ